ncbi:MAG: hypothetical protein FI729_03040 [SAR202 cluster bacterium]|nr:hypothetical protein [SAR202 cluster bacterium]|tara:strand:+ start:6176 stop:6562 length:387 start_codon:yes stop_codon:yes gene_type:complete
MTGKYASLFVRGIDKVRSEIPLKYKKDKERKIAEKCLQLGHEWTRIVSGGFESVDRFRVPAGANAKEWQQQLKDECKQYIKDGLDPQDAKGFFPVWVFPFILQVLLSAVINWIVRKIFDNIFEKDEEE